MMSLRKSNKSVFVFIVHQTCCDFDLRNINLSVSPPHLLLSFLISVLSNMQQDRNNLVSWTNKIGFLIILFP